MTCSRFPNISRETLHTTLLRHRENTGCRGSLVDFPRIGRVVPEFEREDIREIIVYRYRVIYEIEGDNISIATVVHGARLLKRALKGRSIRRRERGD